MSLHVHENEPHLYFRVETTDYVIYVNYVWV